MTGRDRLLPTGSATIGPFFPPHLVPPGMSDLTRRRPDAPVAEGRLVHLSGRVVGDDPRPVGNFLVEIWQADANGRLDHPADRRNTPLDRNFAFWGRAVTDSEGRYAFCTVKPGPVPERNGALVAAPYIAVTLLGSGLMRRRITRIYFPDELRNAADPVLQSIADPEIRARLIARPAKPAESGGILAITFDIVLRGAGETPYFLD